MIKNSKKAIVFVTITLVFIILAGLGTGLWFYCTSPVLKKGDNKIFTIKEGMGLKEVSEMLEKDGLIKRHTGIQWAKGQSQSIVAGAVKS